MYLNTTLSSEKIVSVHSKQDISFCHYNVKIDITLSPMIYFSVSMI